MQQDPFGNLIDWGPVLELIGNFANNGKLAECQPGLIRILRYKCNWRLREEVLKNIGEIEKPSDELVFQVLRILDDDNIYYDTRILAGDALIQFLSSGQSSFNDEIKMEVRKVLEKRIRTPQPPFFEKALKRLYSTIDPEHT